MDFIYNRYIVGWYIGYYHNVIVSSGRYSDLDNEVISLRIQRNLLKEELLKQKRNHTKKESIRKK